MQYTSKILAHYVHVIGQLNWSEPDHNGLINVRVGELAANVAPLINKKEYEWSVYDVETGKRFEAGTEATVEKAKQKAEESLKNKNQAKKNYKVTRNRLGNLAKGSRFCMDKPHGELDPSQIYKVLWPNIDEYGHNVVDYEPINGGGIEQGIRRIEVYQFLSYDFTVGGKRYYYED